MVNTLLFRNRIENGLQLIDEEQLKWEECLHRYDPIEKIIREKEMNENQGKSGYGNAPTSSNHRQPEIIPAKPEPIITAIDSLYAHKTIFHRSKPLKRQALLL